LALSLYRKYRPATFTDVVGQEHIETTLCNAVRTGSVSHAYLFCGPRGTGKTTTARLLAKALLCEKAPTEQPDGTCLECQEIASGVHPDVYELDAASRTGVENVREEIIGRVQFAPTRGSYKIYIIDEVHMLSTAAFNALLKVIEEPPPHVIFVLCTTDAHKVPETIKSRCQQFEFHRLSEEHITARLNYICEKEGYKAEPEAVSLIAQRSQGGMRDAISSLEQVAVFTGGNITFDAAESLLGEVSAEQLFSVSTLLAERNVAGCFAWVASFTQSGTDIAQFARDLSAHIRNIYVASVLGSDRSLSEIIPADEELIKRYKEQADLFASSDRLAHVLLVLGELSMQLRYSANARLALEIALTRIARPESDLSLDSLAARVAVLEQGGGGANRMPAPVVTSPAAAAPAPAAPASANAATAAAPATPDSHLRENDTKGDEAAEPLVGNGSEPPRNPEPPAGNGSKPVRGQAETPAKQESNPHRESEERTGEDNKGSWGDEGSAHRLWIQVIKELQAQKKPAVVALLGGSAAHLDPKNNGLLIELPKSAAFAKQTLERAENKDLIMATIEKVHGVPLPLSYKLGATGDNTRTRNESQPAAPDRIDQVATMPNKPEISANETVAPSDTEQKDTLSFEDMLSASFGTEISVDAINPHD
jgi:DNA polymerase-3 subunit gamma/tau